MNTPEREMKSNQTSQIHYEDTFFYSIIAKWVSRKNPERSMKICQLAAMNHSNDEDKLSKCENN